MILGKKIKKSNIIFPVSNQPQTEKTTASTKMKRFRYESWCHQKLDWNFARNPQVMTHKNLFKVPE